MTGVTMELRQLRYFIAVAEEGSFGGAAQRVHVTQPPVTRQIHALEQELKVTLFVRTPRGAILTEAGRVFLEEAREIIERSRSEEHTSELQSLMRISYAVFCLKKKKTKTQEHTIIKDSYSLKTITKHESTKNIQKLINFSNQEQAL